MPVSWPWSLRPSTAFPRSGGVPCQPPDREQLAPATPVVGLTWHYWRLQAPSWPLQDDFSWFCPPPRTLAPIPLSLPGSPGGSGGLRTGWRAGSEGQADVSGFKMIFVTGRLGFHWEAAGQAWRWVGDRAGGDFELGAGRRPPFPYPDHGLPSCTASMHSLPPHNASLCPEPPGTPVT